MARQLTKLEKQIKQINTRIVNQAKSFGIQDPLYQNYIGPLLGQNFVKEVPRKIADSSSGPVYVTVPQLITSNIRVDSGFVKAFNKKLTPAQERRELIRESKEMYAEKLTREQAEDLLRDYTEAQSSISSLLLEYYDKSDPQEIEGDDTISLLRKSHNTRLELVTAYRELSQKVEALR